MIRKTKLMSLRWRVRAAVFARPYHPFGPFGDNERHTAYSERHPNDSVTNMIGFRGLKLVHEVVFYCCKSPDTQNNPRGYDIFGISLDFERLIP